MSGVPELGQRVQGGPHAENLASVRRDRTSYATLAGVALVSWTTWTAAQDYSVLRINEVITDNETTGPTDSNGSRHGMVEIYNSGDVPLTLGAPIFRERIALSRTPTQPLLGIWTFPAGTVIPARGFLVVFLESDPEICDLHTGFDLADDGSEPITIWGKADAESKRPIIDQAWLPPLPSDVSFARYPDGAGPAPVPVGDTFRYFGFHPPGKATFGDCQGSCATFDRVCTGAPDTPWENVAPSVSRAGHSTNHPGAGEAVEIIASVKDDKEPVPPNIAHRWSLWAGAIPGQPAGAVVEFTIHVRDAEGLTDDEPNAEDLCPEGIGPCSVVGGPGCEKEPAPSLRYRVCEVPFRYVSGYRPSELLRGIVINEVVSSQSRVFLDDTDSQYDDFFEICNGSGQESDLSGFWLSDRPFTPEAWQFPPGSRIGPGERLVIWADADGGFCPRPGEKTPGDGQDCPDPTHPDVQEYHTSFKLEKNGDELYLFDRAETGFGVIHGIEFGPQSVNTSWSLIPDCDRNGTFVLSGIPTPGEVNAPDSPFRRGNVDELCAIDLTDALFILEFLFRGDAIPTCEDATDVDDNGRLELTDAVFLLNHLFQGGEPPPFPGTGAPGADPTPDDLSPCLAPSCP